MCLIPNSYLLFFFFRSIVLTMCEILKIPAASCMVYSSSLDLDESIVKSFSSFLNSYDRQLFGKGNKFASFSSANKGCTGNLYI